MWNIMHRILVRLAQDEDFIPEKPFWENLYYLMVRDLSQMGINELPERREKLDGRDLLKLIQLKPDVVDVTRSESDMNIFDIALMLSATHVAQNGTKILIKYNMISAGNTYELVDFEKYNLFELYDGMLRECRGIVVDMKTGELLVAPFRKFANMGEWKETQQDALEERMRHAKVVEFSNKLDGSLIIARCVNNDICVYSSGQMDEEITPHISIAREYINSNPAYQKFLYENTEYTCMFELIDYRDTHVVPIGSKKCGLYLTGMRNIRDGFQKTYHEIGEIAKLYDIFATNTFNKSFAEILNMRDTASYEELEGFVVNIDGYFVKIKCENYLLFQKVRNNLTVNDIIPSLLAGTSDDILSYLNDGDKAYWTAKFNEVVELRQKILEYVEKMWTFAPKTSRKESAVWIIRNCKKPFQGYVMAMMSGKAVEPWLHCGYPVRYVEFMELAKYL